MKRSKEYERAWFSAETIREAFEAFMTDAESSAQDMSLRMLTFDIKEQDADWSYDELPQWLSAYRRNLPTPNASISAFIGGKTFNLSARSRGTSISIGAASEEAIEDIGRPFERDLASAVVPAPPSPPPPPPPPPVVFIGHGGSSSWKELRDHLRDLHGFECSAYESGSRAGHTVRDVLAQLVANASVAVLVMTGEDETLAGQLRARQNVVHEIGLFQGRLGFAKVIAVIEEGVEEFSNLQGVNMLYFTPGNIREVFGDVVAAINDRLK